MLNFIKKIFKGFYNFIPFKQQIFSILKIFWTPPESIFKHLHFKGKFKVKINQSKSFMLNHFGLQCENEIFWMGWKHNWEKESIKVWGKLCKDSQIILDIGANTGIYSLVAKTINPNSKVYAFEPELFFYDMLQKNNSLNNFDIQSYPKAISNYDGDIIIEAFSGQSKSFTVESITLDTFIKQNEIKKIDLIKIDVETHEPKVLEGFLNHLSTFRPTLLIEILNNDIAEIVYNQVRELGYLYFNIDERGNGSIRQTDIIEKSDYYNYLLCSPETANKIGLLNK
jgi:FkbM family methyltransferase